VHVDMVFAHHAFEYLHVLGVTDLNEQVTTPDFDVARQHVIAILGHPDQMCGQSGDGVVAVSVLFHRAALLACPEVCSN